VADDGKSPSILDMLGTALSLNGSFGGGLLGGSGGVIENSYVTNEHYYLYKQDIERLASMGLKYYSFSIPWTRIMPFALPGSPVNTDAISHYNDVINFVLEKGMQPVVTLHHFDTPLQFFGGGQEYLIQLAGTTSQYGLGLNFGFQNSTFEDAYVHYAQIVMSHFADRVPLWITINEPQIGVVNGIAVNTVIKSHARVVHYYREVLKGTGKVSMKMGGTPAVPADPTNSSHIETANLYTELYIGAFLNPLALGIDYPEAFKLSVPDYVPLSKADLEYINGTMGMIKPKNSIST
jgi:beta-glucosidase/6-phospho-beta-glucosidase/beta-galactosidase